VSRRSLVKIDKALPMAEAALFGCAVMTGVGAVVNTAQGARGRVHGGDRPRRCRARVVLGAKAAGARQIVAVDLSDAKLELAKSLGATHTFNAGAPDTVEKIREATSGGVEYAFELAGSARALESAYKITRRGGTTVTAGLPPPTATMPLSPLNLVAEERTLKGSYIGTCVPSRDIPRYVRLYQQGKLAVDRLMTGTLKLDQINEGFDLLHEGKAVRQVILFD
jgi:alcohol dehydrogenase